MHRITRILTTALAAVLSIAAAIAQNSPAGPFTIDSNTRQAKGDLVFPAGRTLNVSTGTLTLADNQIPWVKVNKTGSSLLDLVTRSAGDLNSGTLLAARLPAFTGDATSSAGTAALTLATVNSNVGTFGNATQSLTATVDAKGRVTAMSAQTVTPAWSSITSKPTTLSGYGITDAPTYGDVSNRAAADTLFFDGITASMRAYWPLGAAGDGIGAGKLTVLTRLMLPSALPSVSSVWNIASTNAGIVGTATFGMSCYLTSTALRVALRDAAGVNASVADVTIGAAALGKPHALAVEWDGAAAPLVWIDGVSQVVTPSTIGTAPGWAQAIDDDYLVIGARADDTSKFSGTMAPSLVFNYLLSSAEIATWAQTMLGPNAGEVSVGSMANKLTGISSTFSSDVADATTFASTYGPSWGVNPAVTTVAVSSRNLTIGWVSSVAGIHLSGLTPAIPVGSRIRVTLNVTSKSGTWELWADGGGILRFPLSVGVNAIEYTTADATPIRIRGSSAGTLVIDANAPVKLQILGPLFRPVIQPIRVVDDIGSNHISGYLTDGVTPVTRRTDWRIVATTSTNGNQQLLGAPVFFNTNNHRLDNWVIVNAGTSETVSLGNASAGTQYLSAGTEAAGPNDVTLATRFNATTSLWCNASGTATLTHVITGHLVQ